MIVLGSAGVSTDLAPQDRGIGPRAGRRITRCKLGFRADRGGLRYGKTLAAPQVAHLFLCDYVTIEDFRRANPRRRTCRICSDRQLALSGGAEPDRAYCPGCRLLLARESRVRPSGFPRRGHRQLGCAAGSGGLAGRIQSSTHHRAKPSRPQSLPPCSRVKTHDASTKGRSPTTIALREATTCSAKPSNHGGCQRADADGSGNPMLPRLGREHRQQARGHQSQGPGPHSPRERRHCPGNSRPTVKRKTRRRAMPMPGLASASVAFALWFTSVDAGHLGRDGHLDRRSVNGFRCAPTKPRL